MFSSQCLCNQMWRSTFMHDQNARYLFTFFGHDHWAQTITECHRQMSYSCVPPSPPFPFLLHPSFRCRGYSRTWCGSWPVRLCSTDGPVLSLPLYFSSCLPPLCLCHVQLRSSPDIYSYANMSSWVISPAHTYTQVLCPYGTPPHLRIFRSQHPHVLSVFYVRGCVDRRTM